MIAYNPIGLLTGPGGNPTGIDEYVDRCRAADVPVIIGANDGLAGVIRALETPAHPRDCLGYRVVLGGGEEFSVPNYDLPAASAAAAHWSKIEEKFPEEVRLNRDRIWILPINEVDKNRADWVGRFSEQLAKIANADGYRVALPAWASGEPEIDDWKEPGFISFLRFVAEDPSMRAVALHEYSYERDDINAIRPWLIGRFEFLFEVCDEYGIPRPPVIISEWGWTYDDLPGVDQAMADIAEIADLYATHPEILGAFLWYLGPGFADIANKAQRLILPIAEFSETFRKEIPDPEPDPDPDPIPTKTIEVDHVEDGREIVTIGGLGDRRVTNFQVRIRDVDENSAGEWHTADVPAVMDIIGELFSPRIVECRLFWEKDVTVEVEVPVCPEPEPEPEPEPPPPPDAYVFGIDISHWQGPVDYAKLGANEDVDFVIVKATESDNFVDSRFAEHWAGIKLAGKKRGAYHFFRFAASPIAQAKLFIDTLGGDTGEMPLVVDVEDTKGAAGSRNPEDLLIFLQELRRLTGEKSIIYSARWYWNHYLPAVPWAKDYSLWVADYRIGIETPLLPDDWTEWDMWQFTSSGLAAEYGIINGGNVDENIFSGDSDDFAAWRFRHKSPEPEADLVDLGSRYSLPDGEWASDIIILANSWAGDERTQLLRGPNDRFYLTKNSNYERYSVRDGRVFYERDTSVSDQLMIDVVSAEGWILDKMKVGSSHTAVETVTHRLKNDAGCPPDPTIPTYSGTFVRKLVAHHSSYTIPESGLVFEDVAEVSWMVNGEVEETHWLVPGLPRVRWENRGGLRAWASKRIKRGDEGDNVLDLKCE